MREVLAPPGIGAEVTERSFVAGDAHVHAARDAMVMQQVMQQRRRARTVVPVQVLEDERLGVFGEVPVGVRSEMEHGVSDETVLPPHAGAEQECLPAFEVLHHVAELEAERLRDDEAGFLEQRVEGGAGEGTLPEFDDDGLPLDVGLQFGFGTHLGLLHPLPLDGFPERMGQTLELLGHFDDAIRHAPPHRFHGRLFRAVCGDDDDGQVRIMRAKRIEEVESVGVREVEEGQCEVVRALGKPLLEGFP